MTVRLRMPAMLLAMLFACLSSIVDAQEVRSFDNEINATRTIAEEVRNFYRDLDGAQSENTVLFTPDLPLAKKWLDDLAARYDAIGKLFEQGKEAEARAAWGAADALRERRWRWRERFERRVRQFDIAPNEWWYNDNRRWLFRGGESLVNDWCEARKTASEAWGKLAEMTTPERSDLEIQALYDAASVATVDAQVAESKLGFRREFNEVIENRAITPEVDAKLKVLQQTVDDQIEVGRQRDALERKSRILDQQRRQQQDELRKIYERAKKDAEDAARAAKEAKRKAEEEARAAREAKRQAEEEARRAKKQN